MLGIKRDKLQLVTHIIKESKAASEINALVSTLLRSNIPRIKSTSRSTNLGASEQNSPRAKIEFLLKEERKESPHFNKSNNIL